MLMFARDFQFRVTTTSGPIADDATQRFQLRVMTEDAANSRATLDMEQQEHEATRLALARSDRRLVSVVSEATQALAEERQNSVQLRDER